MLCKSGGPGCNEIFDSGGSYGSRSWCRHERQPHNKQKHGHKRIKFTGPLDPVGKYEYIESSQGSPDPKIAGCTKEWTRRGLVRS